MFGLLRIWALYHSFRFRASGEVKFFGNLSKRGEGDVGGRIPCRAWWCIWVAGHSAASSISASRYPVGRGGLLPPSPQAALLFHSAARRSMTQKKTDRSVLRIRMGDKMRSDPRLQFWYAAIKGHFWSFLVSNIFSNPLFLQSIFCMTPIHIQNSKFSHSQWRIPYVCFVYALMQKTRLVLCRAGGLKMVDPFYDLAAIFRIRQISIFKSSHTGGSTANGNRFASKWGNSSVHGTAPPSPKFPVRFGRCCSLGGSSFTFWFRWCELF